MKQVKANRVLSKEYTDHSKHLFQQAKRWLYTRTSSDWLCSLQPKMEKLYPVSKNKTWRLTVAQTMSSSLQNSCLNWKKKKIGKSTKPLKHNLNQIPYDYTVEVTNRFKGLDLIGFLKNYGQRFVNTVQEAMIKTIPKKAKWLSEEALQIAEERREAKGKGERERYTQLNAEFQRRARRVEKGFLNDQCKETEENNRMGKTRDLLRKSGDSKRTCHARMGTIKDRKGKGLTEAEEIKKRWQEYTELYKKGLITQITTLMWSIT